MSAGADVAPAITRGNDMTTHFDLHDHDPSARTASVPSGRQGRRRWLIPLCAAAAATTIGGVAVGRHDTPADRLPQQPAAARSDGASVAIRPTVQSSIIRAERLSAPDDFELVRVDRAVARPSVESSIIRAERLWASDEFELAPVEDVCPMQRPC
jgi:hypothetical protein